MYAYASSTPPFQFASDGDLLCTNAKAFLDTVLQAVDSGLGRDQTVTLDLTLCRMIDSVGLNVLVTIIKRVKAKSASVKIIVRREAVRRTLAFTRIDVHATVVDG